MARTGYRTCKRCGEKYLHWVNVSGKWRLSIDRYGKNLHQCKKIVEDEDIDEVKPKTTQIFHILKVNQRVMITYDKNGMANKIGRIVSIRDTGSWADYFYGVEMESEFEFGHDCLGLCKKGTGYYVHMDNLESVPEFI